MGVRPRLVPHPVNVTLLCVFAVMLAACSNDPAPPRDLLLGPEDFPGQSVTETSRETGDASFETTLEASAENSPDEPAVQVELNGSDFILLESLVLFESENLARAILSGIKQDQVAQGVTPRPVEGFEDVTGVIKEHWRGNGASTLFFVQERALVRITLTGQGQTGLVWEIAALAREKSRNQ